MFSHDNVYFYHKSFYNHYIGDYDFIYCCNTIFSEEDNIELYKKLLREFKGLCVLFTQPSCLHHYFIESRHIGSSWCENVTIYIYLFHNNQEIKYIYFYLHSFCFKLLLFSF